MKIYKITIKSLVTLSLITYMIFINAGCGDSNADKKTESKDTTIRQDTIKVDPENFSEPH
jgi:hypothetical protein